MKKTQIVTQISLIHLDQENPLSLSRQIYDGLLQAILEEKLSPGTRLPSHLDMARLLNVSRNTVVTALDQLASEGYLQTRVGSGSYIASELPETYTRSAVPVISPPTAESGTGSRIQPVNDFSSGFNPDWYLPNHTRHNLFRNGLPDIQSFPHKIWEKLTLKHLRGHPEDWFDFNPNPAGNRHLREVLAQHLRIARSVNCSRDHIMIVTGAEQVAYLAARLLLKPGERAWVEEPGFPGAARAFMTAGITPVPIPVDSSGLDVNAGLQMAPDARLVYITPSHQFPIGSTLSWERRQLLLNWAVENNAWIIEDDYDSEYRYDGRPLSSIQGLDQHQRVIYLGTFTKVLYPGIRLDYAVLPRGLFDDFLAARTSLDIHIATLNQAIIADFISEGHFSRHIRRMRSLYHSRRDTLMKVLKTTADGWLTPDEANCGMHVCTWLPEHIADEDVFREAEKINIEAIPLSRFYLNSPSRNGLVLGFTACKEEFIQPGVQALMDILKTM
jgi:GntR family transcriptional regulator / MocR family aminotransferase